jgi:hypothetical protein
MARCGAFQMRRILSGDAARLDGKRRTSMCAALWVCTSCRPLVFFEKQTMAIRCKRSAIKNAGIEPTFF